YQDFKYLNKFIILLIYLIHIHLVHIIWKYDHHQGREGIRDEEGVNHMRVSLHAGGNKLIIFPSIFHINFWKIMPTKHMLKILFGPNSGEEMLRKGLMTKEKITIIGIDQISSLVHIFVLLKL
ncbi:hypothetical protein ACJX0J_037256, partial [Zea mays]